jgi:hypothetical protein
LGYMNRITPTCTFGVFLRSNIKVGTSTLASAFVF